MNELVEKQNTEVSVAPISSAESMIMQAIDKGASVETMEKLLDMRERINAELAKSEYFTAMSRGNLSRDEVSPSLMSRAMWSLSNLNDKFRVRASLNMILGPGDFPPFEGLYFRFLTEKVTSHEPLPSIRLIPFERPIDLTVYCPFWLNPPVKLL